MPSQNDYELLIDSLIEREDTFSHSVEFTDSSMMEVKRDLDLLQGRLRLPAPDDEFEAESACERALELVEAIGRDPSFSTRQMAAARTPTSDLEDPLPGGGTLGQYQLLMKLGQGGFGAVYKALHSRLDKVVALKVLTPSRLQNAQAVSRFNREMRAVGKLHHVNIVAAHDAGESDGMHYLVMELVDGIDLRELVKQRGRLPIGAACELIRQAALGLQHAHEHGLVHRDIKPSNLMLTLPRSHDEAPSVKVLDLGLALLDEDHLDNFGELTATGQVMGTLEYMAPEQGADTHDVDIRADVYTLGASLYKLLTGKAPFSGDQYRSPVKLLMAVATQNAPPLVERCPEITPDLDAIIQRMLSKQPADRFATPYEVADALAPFSQPADLRALVDFLATAPQRERVDVNAAAFIGTQATKSPSQTSSHRTAPETTTYIRARPFVKRDGSSWISRIAMACGACGVLIAAALYLIEVRTPRGTLIIHSDAPDIKVKINRDGKEIVNGWSLQKGQDNKQLISTGEVEIELPAELTGEYTVTPNRVMLTKDKQEIVKIERKENARAADQSMHEHNHDLVVQTRPAILPPDALSADRDLVAAQSWVSRGGHGIVVLKSSNKHINISKNQRLPVTPFEFRAASASTADMVAGDLEPFVGLPGLQSVVVEGGKVDAQAIQFLSQIPNLRKIKFVNCQIWTSEFRRLRELPFLHEIEISAKQVDDDWKFLGDLTHLRTMKLIDYHKSSSSDFLKWGDFSQLRTIVIEAQVEDEMIAKLHAKNPLCRVIGVASPPSTWKPGDPPIRRQLAVIGSDPVRGGMRTLLSDGFRMSTDDHWEAGQELALKLIRDQRQNDPITVRRVWAPPQGRFTKESLSGFDKFDFVTLDATALVKADQFVNSLPAKFAAEEINLSNSDLTDKGLVALARLDPFPVLKVTGTHVTADGIEGFTFDRPACQVINDFLPFKGPMFVDEVPPAHGPAPAVSDPERTAVELWQQRLGSGLVFTYGAPGSANFDPFTKLPDGGIQFVLAHGANVKGLTDEDLSIFTKLGGLKYLEPTGPEIDMGAVFYLKQIPTLIDLEVGGSRIPTSAIAELGSHIHLMNLGVAGKMVDDQWKFLRYLPSLRCLRIHDLQPKPEDWQHLQAGHKLRQLHFFSDIEVVPAEVASFQQNNPLCRVMVGYPKKRSVGNDPQREAVRQLAAQDLGINIGIGEPRNASVAQVLADPFPFYVDFIHIKLPKGASIDAKSLKPLQAILFNELRVLWEGGNTDDFVANLPNELAAQRLNLTGCDLTDKGLLRMHQISPPSILDIRSTRVTREGVMAYQNAFPTCKVLSDR